MAADARPVRDPRLRGDAAADAGLPRRAALPRLARALADGRLARRSVARRRDPRVAGPRLQPARAQPPPRRARRRRARVARRPDRAARRRAVHGGRGPIVRVRRRRPAARHERPAHRGAHGTPLRPRLRSGADGPRPHGLPRARPALRRVPARRALPVPRHALRAAAQAGALRGLVPPAPSRNAPARRVGAARARRASTPTPSPRWSATGSSRRATASCGSRA